LRKMEVQFVLDQWRDNQDWINVFTGPELASPSVDYRGLDHGPASRLGAKRPQAEAVPFARRVTRPARDAVKRSELLDLCMTCWRQAQLLRRWPSVARRRSVAISPHRVETLEQDADSAGVVRNAYFTRQSHRPQKGRRQGLARTPPAFGAGQSRIYPQTPGSSPERA
jgi:hypothetical protein